MAKKDQNPLTQISQPKRIKAITGGWNARDPLPDMPPGDAIILQNMIPGLTGVALRPGTFTFATGIGGRVSTLMNWNGPASGKLFAASTTKIFDVTAGGVVGAAAVTGLSSAIWYSCMFGTPQPANYLIAGNGVDYVQAFNGSAWSVPAIVGANQISGTSIVSIATPAVISWTGHGLSIGAQVSFLSTTGALPAPLALGVPYYIIAAGFGVNAFEISATPGGAAINTTGGTQSGTQVLGSNPSKAYSVVAPIVNRLWFVEKNTLHVWYLGIGAIQGLATLFDLSQQCAFGGSLVGMASWSQDGGSGPNDYSCFFTSAGEVIIYQGTDPSSLSTWGLVGRFRIPPPVGTQCVLKSGSDVAVITTLGVIALSSILPISISGQGKEAVTDKIRGAFQTAAAAAATMPGWQVVEFPSGGIVIGNIPQSDGVTFQQYVMSTVTGSWCYFINLNSFCWSLFGNLLFYGDGNGNVIQFGVGSSDNGVGIPFVALPAFSDFASSSPLAYTIPNGYKQFLMARAAFTAVAGTAPPLSALFDYNTTLPSVNIPPAPATGPPWDTSPWDSTPWGPTSSPTQDWQSVEGMGQVGTILVQGTSLTPLILNHIDVIMQDGGMF